jgi:hypothetical protein
MNDTDAGADLAGLFAARTKAHRLDATAPMSSVGELEEWLDDRGIVLVGGRSALPNAVEAIAGGPIDGSWWGHPEGSRIYRLLNELEEGSAGFIELALAEAKRTVIAPRLVPTVRALAGDPGRRARVLDNLKAPARKLYEALGDGGVVRSDDAELRSELGGNGLRAARMALESGLLARSTSLHTASGHHASVLESYGDRSTAEDGTEDWASAGLTQLLAVALGAAVVADRREVEKWFRFVEPDRERLAVAISQLDARSIDDAGHLWLVAPSH